jgi:hypothetical protein
MTMTCTGSFTCSFDNFEQYQDFVAQVNADSSTSNPVTDDVNFVITFDVAFTS